MNKEDIETVAQMVKDAEARLEERLATLGREWEERLAVISQESKPSPTSENVSDSPDFLADIHEKVQNIEDHVTGLRHGLCKDEECQPCQDQRQIVAQRTRAHLANTLQAAADREGLGPQHDALIEAALRYERGEVAPAGQMVHIHPD